MKTPLVGFDYTSLSSGEVADLKAAAERIRDHHRQTVSNMVLAGKELTAVQARLKHGEFGGWIKTEFGWAERTARRYMQVAAWLDGKTDIVTVLEPTTVYMLSSPSTPAAAAEEVVDRLKRGERLAGRDIKAIIISAKSPQERKVRPQRDARQVAEKAPEIASKTTNGASQDTAATLAKMIRQGVGDEDLLARLLEATTPEDLWSALRAVLTKPNVIDAVPDRLPEIMESGR